MTGETGLITNSNIIDRLTIEDDRTSLDKLKSSFKLFEDIPITGTGTSEVYFSVTDQCGNKTIGKTSLVRNVQVTGLTIDGPTSLCKKTSSMPESTYTATVVPSDATNEDVMWSSSDTSVATIDPQTGVLTATGVGVTTITVQSVGNPNVSATRDVAITNLYDIDIFPENNASGVNINGNIVITFKQKMDSTPGTVSLNDTALAGPGSWSNGGKTYTIAYTGLSYNTPYTIKVEGFKDMAGNEMTANENNSFTTIHSYTVALSQTGTYTFEAQTEGYSPVAPKTITISKTGTGDITNLAVALSGDDPDSFTLEAPETTTLNSTTTSAVFTIKLNDGLTLGTYTATVTVTADNGVNESFNVRFTVSLVPAYTVTYNKNGGTGTVPVDSNTYEPSTIVTVLSPGNLVKTGYKFSGWNTAADGRGTSYAAGDTFTIGAFNITLYAQWTKIPSSGRGSSDSSPAPASTTIKGNVVDETTGSIINEVNAIVTAQANGNKSVSVKATDALMTRQPEGTRGFATDLSKIGFTAVEKNSPSIILTSDGDIQVKNIPNGTESNFDVTFDLGNGQRIIVAKIKVTVSRTGDVTFASTLINPYGIITDANTGKTIFGANVVLYYANTDRNKAAGKTPDTVVALPSINGFEPNNNKNPQQSDSYGAYGFMVFPASDYYIVATKEGYEQYRSPIISVEQDLVKWDFKMHKPTASGVKRISGLSRVDTALEIAKANYTEKIKNVILATADDYPDALAGSVLAYKLNAPFILTDRNLSENAKTYLKGRSLTGATIFGGEGAVSKEVVQALSQMYGE